MKKTLALILVVCLLCIMAVGTTLTYFTDTDFDKNTMTVGKVEIIQNETDRTGAALDADSLKLYPVTGAPATDGLVPVANNGVDKFVNVVLADNSEDAYVRTIFAFERKNDGVSPVGTELKLVTGTEIKMTDITIAKDGVSYVIGVCTYDAPLTQTNKTSAYSLKQVYLDRSVDNTFFDAVGNSYDILVLSQAVQTQGFAAADGKSAAQVALDTAFGEITEANAAEIASWFNN